jgi:hypothetical protein
VDHRAQLPIERDIARLFARKHREDLSSILDRS